MTDKHPYISGTAGITNALNQFKKSFPAKVTAETLKKLGIASNNESYVINIMRFVGAIDEGGNRTDKAAAAFSKHDKEDFEKAFAEMVKSAYSDLFSLHGEASWGLDTNKLISFFRGSDKSSDLVGRRQATTFQVLASFSGHGDIPVAKNPNGPRTPTDRPSKSKKSAAAISTTGEPDPKSSDAGSKQIKTSSENRDFGLTVRIEVNLPPAGDQDTYDRIFRSIRENLLSGK